MNENNYHEFYNPLFRRRLKTIYNGVELAYERQWQTFIVDEKKNEASLVNNLSNIAFGDGAIWRSVARMRLNEFGPTKLVLFCDVNNVKGDILTIGGKYEVLIAEIRTFDTKKMKNSDGIACRFGIALDVIVKQ